MNKKQFWLNHPFNNEKDAYYEEYYIKKSIFSNDVVLPCSFTFNTSSRCKNDAMNIACQANNTLQNTWLTVGLCNGRGVANSS